MVETERTLEMVLSELFVVLNLFRPNTPAGSPRTITSYKRSRNCRFALRETFWKCVATVVFEIRNGRVLPRTRSGGMATIFRACARPRRIRHGRRRRATDRNGVTVYACLFYYLRFRGLFSLSLAARDVWHVRVGFFVFYSWTQQTSYGTHVQTVVPSRVKTGESNTRITHTHMVFCRPFKTNKNFLTYSYTNLRVTIV